MQIFRIIHVSNDIDIGCIYSIRDLINLNNYPNYSLPSYCEPRTTFFLDRKFEETDKLLLTEYVDYSLDNNFQHVVFEYDDGDYIGNLYSNIIFDTFNEICKLSEFYKLHYITNISSLH